MPDKPPAEPTMDEILASIRRIISEDPAPETQAAVAGHDAAPDHPPVEQAAEAPTHEEAMGETHASADEPLVGEAAATASASAFDTLAASAVGSHPVIPLPPPGRTLEDLTADLLRPLLKAWLDENLPEIVRDRVDEEVRRIARSRAR
jgi:cell pole-organizing protein PopZ